ncbi:hypothetical protein CTM97_18320 [Photobacterium phosphoreum]|uniref:Uncharacterized protein n=1 Tax=Photobacterium phosphoreum TaxID=659 RepID=A0A2T3JN76_PHOPO|nr:hypothetical protein [Photobacterium phosphoreum]PSU19712.1 hypothetical protein CTM96_20850 [Photobacterium phosphoreum]PSU38958.1 hypothetical protein CTM97_18320 [Photobacterium phosphoreum]PSU50416.1 hypothetical protein C9J18_14605 [Photobacterium phosphoreum]
MTTPIKLNAGDLFPVAHVTLLDGTSVALGKRSSNATWQAVFVYRGKHCPLCKKNNPFVRPELDSLVNGIGWIRNPENNYPIVVRLSFKK